MLYLHSPLLIYFPRLTRNTTHKSRIHDVNTQESTIEKKTKNVTTSKFWEKFTYTNPFSQSLSTGNWDQANIVVSTKSFNQFNIVRLVAILSQYTELASMLLNNLCTFVEPSSKPSMGKWFPQHKLQGCHYVHGLTQSWSRCCLNRYNSLFTAMILISELTNENAFPWEKEKQETVTKFPNHDREWGIIVNDIMGNC